MIFLCGLFIPVEALPAVLKPFSFILPLTYGVDILKYAIVNTARIAVWLDFSILASFSVALFLFSTRNIQRKWIF
jgi:ABC-2 type transport system permease protein